MAIPLHRSSLLDDRSCGETGSAIARRWSRTGCAPVGRCRGRRRWRRRHGARRSVARGEVSSARFRPRPAPSPTRASMPPGSPTARYPIWGRTTEARTAVRSIRHPGARSGGPGTRRLCCRLATRPVTARPPSWPRRARLAWQRKGRRWLDVLSRAVQARHATHGEVAFDLEPDLKGGREVARRPRSGLAPREPTSTNGCSPSCSTTTTPSWLFGWSCTEPVVGPATC